MSSNEVRVRIAPSPTGYFHVGTARQAVFNWLYARHCGGKFLLRIEDTDEERSKKEYIDLILDGLRWLGLEWDEEIVRQSTRQQQDAYRPVAERLLEEGKAYRCFCSPEKLGEKRQQAQRNKRTYRYDRRCRDLSKAEVEKNLNDGKPFAVRLKIPLEGTASFDDIVLSHVERDYTEMDDFFILRGNGTPLYNFAVVVDDHDMEISHVIRGNDHLTNTFSQVEIYKALDWNLPAFVHAPLILRPDGSKVSKRKGDKGVTDYIQEGYLSDAFFNFLSLLGWSPKDDREKMTHDELIEAFALKNINPSNCKFDPVKLTALNGEYIREKSNHEIAELLAPVLVERELSTKYWLETRWQWFLQVIGALKERCKLITEFVGNGAYFFTDEFTYDEKGVAKHFSKENSDRYLEKLADGLEKVGDFTAAAVEEVLRELADQLDVKPAKLIHPTRLAVSGLTGGPSLFEMLELIGKEKVIARMRRATTFIREGGDK